MLCGPSWSEASAWLSHLTWGDVPSWLSALGTIGAVIVALGLASRSDRRREQDHVRRQAELVTAWIYHEDIAGAEVVRIIVRNASNQCVYELVANLVTSQGAFRKTAIGLRLTFGGVVGQVPPGTVRRTIRSVGGGMHKHFAVEIAFRDAAGHCWVREGDGALCEVAKPPLDLYRIPRPYELLGRWRAHKRGG
jgi:hypothetical protein